MKEKIAYLVELGKRLKTSDEFQQKMERAEVKNPWFVKQFVDNAVNAVCNQMLNEAKLNEWLSRYEPHVTDKTIGLIFAGNLPLVGLHDFLCCYVAGCRMKIKLSGKDDELFPALLKILCGIDTELAAKVQLVEKLKDYDAVIATGSDNTNRYFEYYFRDYAKILRRNRNSVAVLTGKETPEQLQQLSDDIFMYFGFGCRNVSKLYVPQGYDITQLFPQFNKYMWLHQNTKFMNNYDYQRTILMLNKTPHLANEFVMITENEAISSPIATLHYEQYTGEAELKKQLEENTEKIQCIVSGEPRKWTAASSVVFGESQHPELWDYADGVDTLEFLLALDSVD